MVDEVKVVEWFEKCVVQDKDGVTSRDVLLNNFKSFIGGPVEIVSFYSMLGRLVKTAFPTSSVKRNRKAGKRTVFYVLTTNQCSVGSKFISKL